MKRYALFFVIVGILMSACEKEDEKVELVDLGITAVADANAGTSYSLSKSDIHIRYGSLPYIEGIGNLRDAIAYIDANGDGLTDVFMATGEYLLEGELNCLLAINDGDGDFYASTEEFNDDMPPATHARKTIVTDFNNDGLLDMLIFDHGYDANPYPGNQLKLIMQDSVGHFSWSKLPETGFFHGGASGDIDNDGDMDVFVGGLDPFFYINDGKGNFTKVQDRYDLSVSKVFSAEMIDVDEDGFVDLLVGAHEQDGDKTSIFWGNSTGSYSSNSQTEIAKVSGYGTVLDFEAQDLDGDGDLDVVINRTGGGNSNFYVGRRIQLLMNSGGRTFTDETSQIDNPGQDNEVWFPWIRVQDIDKDGDLDIFSDNLEYELFLLNDGQANFTREWSVD